MSGIITSNFGTLYSSKLITVVEKSKTTQTAKGTTIASNAIAMTAGRVYIVMLAWDPSGASVPTITLSDTANTYTALSTLYPTPATTGNLTGVLLQSFITTAGATATRTVTGTLSASTTNKVMTVIELTGATTTQRNTATSSRGTTWANYNAPTGNMYDIVLTTFAQETSTVPTSGSTSTTDGSWSTISNNYTSGGQAITNVGVSYQYKILTTTSTQTNAWTLGATNNWGSQTFVLQSV